MKKIVFCLVTLMFALPITSSAEETLSTSESATIESSSTIDSTQNTEDAYTKTADSSLSSSVTESTSTETSSTTKTAYGDFVDSTLIVLQGEKVTAKMLQDDASIHGAAFRDLELLDVPSTETLGKNKVKVSFMIYPLEEGQGEKQQVTLDMGYRVIKDAPTYAIQFISYDSDNKQIKGQVSSVDGSPVSNALIYGDNTTNYPSVPTTITEFYHFADLKNPVSTDSEGYFILPYQDNYSFFAFNNESNDYSPVYTLTDKAFAGATGTADSSKSVNSTDSSEKKEEKKKGLFPNTGEKNTVYYSIAGIAIILLAILFLFIKSKKNKK